MTRKAKPETYVRAAKRLARTTPGGVFSAGAVAYLAHRRPSRLVGHDFDADDALQASGLFERASFINANSLAITTWRMKVSP